MMTNERFNQETQILDHYLGRSMGQKSFAFNGLSSLKAVVKTNNNKVYVLYFDLSTFPVTKPKVYVTQMLYTKNGAPMDSPDGANHTLSSWNGWTQLCHYADNQ